MAVFTKPAITPTEQLRLLKARGLTILDEPRSLCFLEAVIFFRLTPYMRPFQIANNEHQFKPRTKFSQLTNLYEFDRRLRLKEKQRTALEDYNREYRRIDNLKTTDNQYKAFIKDKRRQESYFRHYALTYNQPELMPSWAMLEEISLGELSQLYKGLAKDKDIKVIANGFDLYPPLLESWLHTITVIRNICAHHARLWNRELGIKPAYPTQKDFSWPSYLDKDHPHTRVAIVFSILHHMMKRISPDTEWYKKLFALFDDFKEIHLTVWGNLKIGEMMSSGNNYPVLNINRILRILIRNAPVVPHKHIN